MRRQDRMVRSEILCRLTIPSPASSSIYASGAVPHMPSTQALLRLFHPLQDAHQPFTASGDGLPIHVHSLSALFSQAVGK